MQALGGKLKLRLRKTVLLFDIQVVLFLFK